MSIATLALRSTQTWRTGVKGRGAVILLGYAFAFFITHRLAVLWGGASFYSLWYPAAGVRLALLWRGGARLTPAITLVEILVQLGSGVISTRDDWLIETIGVARPVIAYGVTIAIVGWATRRGDGSLTTPPMPFGLTAVLAPVTAAMFALPWALLRPDITHVEGARQIVASLTAFALGDLLGVLLVASPLLWLADIVTGSDALPFRMPPLRHVAEAAAVLTASLLMVAGLAKIGLGLPETPVLLGTTWIGLRFGRSAAWSAIVLVALVVLPFTAGAVPIDRRLALHMSLAAVVVVGYLAGSFADAEARARADLARRDRLLFQAERLKTLRAMSVAVIHEISQPLSTLAIEARHLAEITTDAGAEVAASSRLIDRKAEALSVLVRRLRRFGGRAVDEPSLLPISALLDMVIGLAGPEARIAGVPLIHTDPDPDLAVLAQEVELAQALVNVVRNALQACGDGIVAVAAVRDAGTARLTVTNRCRANRAPHAGMGVGLLVARTIVEAHNGRIAREQRGDVEIVSIILPLVGALQ